MHLAGEKLIKSGYKYVVPLNSNRSCTFGRIYNDGKLLPEKLLIHKKSVHITVQDGELPGLGLYLFCREEKLAKLIEAAVVMQEMACEPHLISTHYYYGG